MTVGRAIFLGFLLVLWLLLALLATARAVKVGWPAAPHDEGARYLGGIALVLLVLAAARWRELLDLDD